MSAITLKPKFNLGRLVATPGAIAALKRSCQDPFFFLAKHVTGDWGEVDGADQIANQQAVEWGDRILSAYRTLRNERIWIITEAADDDGSRECTTILLPEEY